MKKGPRLKAITPEPPLFHQSYTRQGKEKS